MLPFLFFRSVIDKANDDSDDEYRVNSPTQMLLSACLRTVERSKLFYKSVVEIYVT